MAAMPPPGPSPAAGFTPPPYEWTGNDIDGDVLAAVAFFFFPVLTFYGSRQFVTSVTSASMLIVAYTAYIVTQHTPPTQRMDDTAQHLAGHQPALR